MVWSLVEHMLRFENEFVLLLLLFVACCCCFQHHPPGFRWDASTGRWRVERGMQEYMVLRRIRDGLEKERTLCDLVRTARLVSLCACEWSCHCTMNAQMFKCTTICTNAQMLKCTKAHVLTILKCTDAQTHKCSIIYATAQMTQGPDFSD